MSDHKASSALATATMLEMIVLSVQYQAAIIRGAEGPELDALRGKAHDLLDAFLDRSSDAAMATLSILPADHPDAAALAAQGAHRLLDEG